MCFVELQIACDSVGRDLLSEVLIRFGVPKKYAYKYPQHPGKDAGSRTYG